MVDIFGRLCSLHGDDELVGGNKEERIGDLEGG